MATSDTGVVKGRFDKLDALRTANLDRARKCAEVTIPTLLPPAGHNPNDPLPTPYQSMGARCLNHLTSKLLITMLPPNTPFFKYGLPPRLMAKIKEEQGESGLKTEYESKIRLIEQDIMNYIEAEGHRGPFFNLLRLLLATGNVLLETANEGGLKVHRLDKYVVRRNPAGQPLEVILKELIDKSEVPKGMEDEKPSGSSEADKKELELYTRCLLVHNAGKPTWVVVQELFGKTVPGSAGTYTEDNMPFLPLALNLLDGEDYGRGPVEEYLGDFISLEELMKAVVQGAAAAARVLFLVRPGGQTNWKLVKKAKNLSAVPGRKEDIECLQVDKLADFKIAYDIIETLKDRLAKAFLLHDSIQRDAERVTAFELRYLAQELEDAMGGIYTAITTQLSKPYLKRVVAQMKDRKVFSIDLPDTLNLTITTGFEALGRGHELQKLDSLLERLSNTIGQEALMQVIGPVRMRTLIDKYAIALGLVDVDEWLPGKDELQAQQQQNEMMNQFMQLMQSPTVVQALKGMTEKGGAPVG